MQKKTFANALKWAYVGNIGDRAISALVMFVLAGMLGPRDFGLVSIGVIYITFAQMFLDQGLASALIQKKDLKQEHCDAVFWANVVTSLCFVVLTICISGWWARVNHAPDLARVLSVLSLSIPLEGLSIVQSAIVKREMNFKVLTIRSNVSVLLGGVTGIALALGGLGVWALVGQQLVRDSSALLLLWGLGDWRPKFEFSWPHLKELLGFSLHSFMGGLAIFADLQAGSLLLGLLFGPVAVGLYRLADRLMGSVIAMTTTSIQSVSLPEFARLQDRPDELRKSAVSCLHLSSILTIPCLVGMAMVSGPLMATLGPKWIPATSVLKILCVQGIIFTLSYFTGPLLTALGRPELNAKLEWARAAVGVAILGTAGLLLKGSELDTQVIGIALARAIPNMFIITPLFLYLLMHFANVSMRELLAALASPFWASLSIVAVVFLLQWTSIATWPRPVVILVVETIIGGAAGLVVLLALDKQIRGATRGLFNRIGLFSSVTR